MQVLSFLNDYLITVFLLNVYYSISLLQKSLMQVHLQFRKLYVLGLVYQQATESGLHWAACLHVHTQLQCIHQIGDILSGMLLARQQSFWLCALRQGLSTGPGYSARSSVQTYPKTLADSGGPHAHAKLVWFTDLLLCGTHVHTLTHAGFCLWCPLQQHS